MCEATWNSERANAGDMLQVTSSPIAAQRSTAIVLRGEGRREGAWDHYWNLPSPSTSSTALQMASCASRHIFSNLARISVLAVPALQRLSGGASMACLKGVCQGEILEGCDVGSVRWIASRKVSRVVER